MTTTEILTGVKNWVSSKLSLKQDVINDLAAIRSGSQAGSTAVQPSDLSSYFNNASYDTNTHRINFYHGQNIVAYVDASPFIVDGMVNDVRIENGYLVIDFNTDSGKQDISIPLTDIFNPNNYYTKGETDLKFTQKQSEIDDLYARIGYYVCSTEGNVAAKTIVANDYTLGNGGSIKVKMTNANTADNATLNINSTGAKALYYAGERASANNSWEAGETVEVYYDGTSYYANNVTGGSGSGDGAFDVSVKYPTSGVDGGNTYTLDGALAVLNANLSANKKKGGMSIKFIQSSDNKYVQYRLMANTFSTTVTDWQSLNADDEPTSRSNNLVKSGGIAKVLYGNNFNATLSFNSATTKSFAVDYKSGEKFTININTPTHVWDRIILKVNSTNISSLLPNEGYTYKESISISYTPSEDITTISIWVVTLYQSGNINVSTQQGINIPEQVAQNTNDLDVLKPKVETLEDGVDDINEDGWVTTERIAPVAVTDDKLAIMEIGSYNLLNPNTVVSGSLNNQGNISSNSSYATSDYIEVKPSTLYSLEVNYAHYHLARAICEYNSAKEFISGSRKEYQSQITTGSTTKYIRVTYPVDSYGQIDLNAQINEGNFKAKQDFFLVIDNQYIQKKFINHIAMPSKLYMLEGVQNNMFIEPIIKRWRPYEYDVRFGGTQALSRMLKRVGSVNAPVSDNTVTAILYDKDDFKSIEEKTATIVAATPSVGNSNIKLTVIGDSIVNGAFFYDAFFTKNYAPNCSFVGLRKINGQQSQYDEGRGGWRLVNYFTIVPENNVFFNPFMQPNGNYRYWGSKQFWKNACDVASGTIPVVGSTEPGYSCGRYDDYVDKFDSSTGLLANPQSGDIMYDITNSKFILYNGSSWEDTTQDTYTWAFDYGKYLTMWGLDTPDIMVWFIGANDFRNELTPESIDFSTWDANMETVIASYLDANPNGKFVLCTTLSTCGNMNNAEMQFTERQNAVMWTVRKHYIDAYDKRESENIYLVDVGITVDNDLGFNVSEQLPYVDYNQSEHKVTVQSGVPHPYPNYPTMGIPLAAFVQSVR